MGVKVELTVDVRVGLSVDVRVGLREDVSFGMRMCAHTRVAWAEDGGGRGTRRGRPLAQ